MMDLHKDFAECATERRVQMEWTRHVLMELAQSSSTTETVVWRTTTTTTTTSSSANNRISIIRPLRSNEIDTLQTHCRCKSNDWTKLRLVLPLQNDITDDQQLSDRLKELVSNTTFQGTVVLILLGSTAATEATTTTTEEENDDTIQQRRLYNQLPPGIHNCSIISNCVIDLSTTTTTAVSGTTNITRIHNCRCIDSTFIDCNAVVVNCGMIVHYHRSNKQQQKPLSISVGPETGGARQLELWPEATMINVGDQLLCATNAATTPTTSNATKSSSSSTTPLLLEEEEEEFNYIGPNTIVRDTPTLDTIYLHRGASIVAASLVRSAILFSDSTIQNAGSVVEHCVLQWNCSITNSAVSNSLLMEQATVGGLSSTTTISNAALGPDVHVAAGEVHASVLGCNTSAHHQSLLIGVLWVTGRGNVGYGANVGSNHTGRLPDQECVAGEGVFWGLSCVVKFPVDLSAAPYSVIAAGVTVAPQRCTMPFSLFVNDNDSSGGTSILPGWVLRNSPYTIVRSEKKFASRRKAVRHWNYTGWKIMRPEIIDLCRAARRNLQQSSSSLAEVSGIGANQLTEKGRLAGIQAYTECIQLYALQGLYNFLTKQHQHTTAHSLPDVLAREFAGVLQIPAGLTDDDAGNNVVRWPVFPWDCDHSPEAIWKYQRSLLASEFHINDDCSSSTTVWARDLLHKFISLEKTHADRVYKCKQRDDTRGMQIIPGYVRAHVLADQDPVILDVRRDLREKEEKVHALLQVLNGSLQSKL